MSDQVFPWIDEGERVLLETPIFSIRAHTRRSPVDADRRGDFVAMHSGDWVNVIAITESGQFVLVEQYRHGIDAVTLEIPGGMMDPGEEPIAACRRELLEETGYGGGEAKIIGVVHPNPAIQINRCFTVLLRDVRRIAEPSPDPLEEIAVQLASSEEVREGVRSGRITHALVVAALYHLAIWER